MDNIALKTVGNMNDDAVEEMYWAATGLMQTSTIHLWKINQKYFTQGELLMSGIAHWTLTQEIYTPSVVDLTNT